MQAEDLINEANKLQQALNENCGIFKVKQANKWLEEANKRPIPKMLFDEFWFEGEVCILFADTNLGKSILAVQIADSISRAFPIQGFRLEAAKQKVLYFDFELSDKQFENRYSEDYANHYCFDDNFLRVEINPEAELESDKSFEETLFVSLEQAIVEHSVRVLIIDNLTYLKNETERAKDALPLMKLLKALKNKYSLSILALAHTPKRDLSKPIGKNDLQGSKMLMSFCDCSFAIGESQKDTAFRYIKQIKVRQAEFRYDAENVCLCGISKPGNFLQFEFVSYTKEREHLKEITETDKKQQQEIIVQLHADGKSYREIGEVIGISHTQVSRILKKVLQV
jgi:RNA polymerase sigma factor (sigma-70 family)